MTNSHRRLIVGLIKKATRNNIDLKVNAACGKKVN